MHEVVARLRVKPVCRHRGTIGKIQVERNLEPKQLQGPCRAIAQSSDLFLPINIKKQRGSSIVKYRLPAFQLMQLRQALDDIAKVLQKGIPRRAAVAAKDVKFAPIAEMDSDKPLSRTVPCNGYIPM